MEYMTFYERLVAATEMDRKALLSADLVNVALSGQMTTAIYTQFLTQAYHHVKHTVPLLMRSGSAVSYQYEFYRNAMAEYVEEELGHQEWVLNDIEACGGSKEAVRHGRPSLATEAMVAYAYYTIDHVNPLAFLGMVHVLEGTSVSVADEAAKRIREATGLPKKAFGYLMSHGALDIEHVKFFENLVNLVTDERDQADIIHAAKRFYALYKGVYDSVLLGDNHLPQAA
jgi:pyrroloquinoline quinone (PQQ) biosynthesis protein C